MVRHEGGFEIYVWLIIFFNRRLFFLFSTLLIFKNRRCGDVLLQRLDCVFDLVLVIALLLFLKANVLFIV